MLKKRAFANSLAALMAICYAGFYILSQVSPILFDTAFNAQFFGADLAPSKPVFSVAGLISMVVMGWILGYVWAWLYNRFAK